MGWMVTGGTDRNRQKQDGERVPEEPTREEVPASRFELFRPDEPSPHAGGDCYHLSNPCTMLINLKRSSTIRCCFLTIQPKLERVLVY